MCIRDRIQTPANEILFSGEERKNITRSSTIQTSLIEEKTESLSDSLYVDDKYDNPCQESESIDLQKSELPHQHKEENIVTRTSTSQEVTVESILNKDINDNLCQEKNSLKQNEEKTIMRSLKIQDENKTLSDSHQSVGKTLSLIHI